MAQSHETIGRYPISIIMAITLHFFWAAGLSSDPSSIGATGPHALVVIATNPHIAAAILFTVATLATLGTLLSAEITRDLCRVIRVSETWVRIFLLLPQQVILWFSLVGAIDAMWLGQFADGVERPHWFLIVDQIPVVLVALGHTAALLLISRGEVVNGGR